MEVIANSLLLLFIVALSLMLVSIICIFKVYQISVKSLLEVYNKDKKLYLQILNGRDFSWIERGANSIKDFGLWWNVYTTIYRGGIIQEIIGVETVIRFKRYFRAMLICALLAILIGFIVISIGFLLAGNRH